jgi:hypothetical protein
LAIAFACVSLGLAAFGIYSAAHSALFLVRVVEISESPADTGPAQPAVDTQELTELAAVPLGKVNLFDLDLGQIEHRVLSNPWVKSVGLWKSFPQTLSIEVTLKSPVALFQDPSGELSYVDSEGVPFGKVNLALGRDLPLLSGFSKEPPERVRGAISLLDLWGRSPAGRQAELASISWEPERGYRGLVVYRMKSRGAVRTMLDFGQDLDADPAPQLKRIGQVLHYLGDNSIPVRQIWADSGKKIVVKTAHGS